MRRRQTPGRNPRRDRPGDRARQRGLADAAGATMLTIGDERIRR